MKKILGKQGVLRCIGALLGIVAIILLIVSAFVTEINPDMILKLVAIVLLLVGGMIISLTAEKHRTFKSLLVFVLVSMLLTWLFPYGYYPQGSADFYEYGMRRIGLVDVSYTIYYAINFIMDKIAFLLVLTGFYGVLAKISGYQKLVESIAKKLSKFPILTIALTGIIMFILTSLFKQTFAVLIFVPFIITILLKMNLDKFTAFAATFGSILVGILGCTYGTDSLDAFNNYLSQEISTGLSYRFIVAAVALVLYSFFLVIHTKKVIANTKKSAKNNELTDDPFEVENTKSKDSSIPVLIVLILVALITILGYVRWEDFGIEIFTTFHKWLIGLEVGDGFTVISYILGVQADALGAFKYVFTISIVILLASALVAFLYKVKLTDYFNAFFEGTKKMLRPVLSLMTLYIIFSVCYMSPVVPTIVNWIANLVVGFNPFITALLAFVTSVFQTDFGYTAYTIGNVLTMTYASDLSIAHTIFTSIYGLVQVFLPTSAILVVGLSFMKVDYKDWLKYIWLFVVGMLVILLILFAVLTYI